MKMQLIANIPNGNPKDNIEGIQDIIQLFYPRYSISDDIAEEGDLQKLVDKEYEEGDCADELLSSEYAGDINNPQIKIDWLQANNHILTTTIQAIIDNIVEVKEIP